MILNILSIIFVRWLCSPIFFSIIFSNFF